MVESAGRESPAGKGVERIFTSFFLSGTGFAIDITLVKELAAYKELMPAAGMPRYVEGTVELYGVRIPVLNLAHRLSIKPSCEDGALAGSKAILVVNIDGYILGLTVDIEPVMEVFSTFESIKPPDAKARFLDFIEGTVESGDATLPILNLSSLFNARDKAALFGVTESEA